jgi:hypothetical protein
MLRTATEVYRGELLPGYYEEWIFAERQRLFEAYLDTLQRLLRHYEQSRDYTRALDVARRAVAADPTRESSHRDLMRLLSAAGEPSAVLHQYQELERLLWEQAGVKPSGETRALALRLAVAPAGRAQPARLEDPARGDAGTIPGQPLPAAQLTGTVTFLLLESEGASSDAGEDAPDGDGRRGRLFHEELRRCGGCVVQERAGFLAAAFADCRDALACAVAMQQALTNCGLRAALHTGPIEGNGRGDGDSALDHSTRLLLAAHAGQILCSEESAVLLRRHLDPGMRLVVLGS